jgi:hypothetical protein
MKRSPAFSVLLLGALLLLRFGLAAAQEPGVERFVDEALEEMDDEEFEEFSRDEVRAFITTHFMQRMTVIAEIAEDDEEEAWELSEEALDRTRDVLRMKDEEPEDYAEALAWIKAREKVLGLGTRLRQADDLHRDELRGKLVAALGKTFDAQQVELTGEAADRDDDHRELANRIADRTARKDELTRPNDDPLAGLAPLLERVFEEFEFDDFSRAELEQFLRSHYKQRLGVIGLLAANLNGDPRELAVEMLTMTVDRAVEMMELRDEEPRNSIAS